MKRLALVLLLAVPLFADVPFASLTGRVLSSADGAPVPGARVTATCDALPQPRITTTLADGTYWLPALAPGRCNVTFAHAGMQTLTRAVELHANELARSDASLQPSADEESVTSTALARSLFERPYAVWSLDAATIERLPMPRSGAGPLALGPRAFAVAPHIDGMHANPLSLATPDAVQQAAVTLFDEPVALTTRSGGEFSASLRATYLHGDRAEVKIESTSGGAIGRSLFVFGAASAGDDPSVREPERSFFGKATAALGTRQSLFATLLGGDDGDDHASVDWTLAATDWITGTASIGSRRNFSARVYALAGDHQLSAGLQRTDATRDALFITDRWSVSPRWVLDANVRVGEEETLMRAGAVFALAGDGRRRIAANVIAGDDRDELQLWFGQQLEANGYARIGVVNHDRFLRDRSTDVVLDAAFRFLVLTVGGNVSLVEHADNTANLWVLFDAPLLDRDVDIALVGRHRDGATALDAALNFAFTHSRFTPFVKLEVTNAFDVDASGQRVWRVGVGGRM